MRSDRTTFARLFGLIVLGVLVLTTLLGGSLGAKAGMPMSIPASDPTSKIDKQVLKDTANGQKASFVILLAQQADLTPAYGMKDQDARGWFVYNTLRDTAARTQAPIRAALTTAKVPFQPYWAANMIVATGDLSLVQSLAARPDVKSIDSNDATKWIDDPSGPTPSSSSPEAAPDTIEWNVQNVNALQVWAQGYTGQGIVVASQDTGVRWTHNALKPQYRGWNGSSADHNYNWWDAIHDSVGNPCGNNSQQPCDDYFHGTHTTGTAVGYDGGANQIGVAPGAKWIACRNMDDGNGTPARYTECFQFMIAPTDLAGQNPNAALRPHVIINSWGCLVSEGCTTGSELETIVNNTQASGIFVEVSAGNSGSGCSSVDTSPATYSASFSTGAIDSSNTLAGFSSRGPSLYYTPGLLKPEISAPGVSVRSATFTSDTAYGIASGTSMAGPHVVGVVALIWSARPALVRDITGTKQLLEQTANPNVIVNPAQTCGGIPSSQIPNNSFGYGRVDALAAFNASGGGTPTPTNTPAPPTATLTNTPTLPTNTPFPPTATHTGTPPPPSPTSTQITPTATPTVCGVNVIQNPGFESGSLPPWVIRDSAATPTVTTGQHHSGNYSALLGMVSGNWGGDSSIYQQVTVPPSGGTLSFWYYADSCDSCHFDYQDAYVTDLNGNILETVMHIQCVGCTSWFNQTYDMATFAGQTVRIEFLVHHDVFGGWNYMYVDDASLLNVCTTLTPAVTGTPPTFTSTPTATPTVCGVNIVQNPGFETGDLPPWVIRDSVATPTVTTGQHHSGNYSALLGSLSQDYWNGESSIYQQVTVPPNGGTLSFWYTASTCDPCFSDYQAAYVTDLNGNVLATVMEVQVIDGNPWTEWTYDMAAFAGQTVRIEFLVHHFSGFAWNYMYVDDVSLLNVCTTPTPVVTGTPPTATSTRTSTITPTFTPTVCGANVIQNGDFGTGSFPPWVILGADPTPTIVGTPPGPCCAQVGSVSGSEPLGDSSFYQQFTVPPEGGTLSYWWNGSTTDTITFDWQDAYITDVNHVILATIMHNCETTGGWINQTFDMSPYAGQTVDLEFLVHQDGFGDLTSMCVNDVVLINGCSTSTPAAATPTSTSTYTPTPVPPTQTPGGSTATPAPSNTPIATDTPSALTGTPTNTPLTPIPTEPTGTPVPGTATPTACVLSFVDVHSTDWFYNYVVWMYCNGIISGYHTAPPCGVAGEACFKPNNWSTRAQVSKIVVLGFNVPINTTGGPHFQDVPAGSTFYNYIETLYNLSAVSGYPCGEPGYPCVPPSNLPYFKPDLNVTRGQLTKILVIGASIPINTTGGPHFQDVPTISVFYPYIETLFNLGSIHGYPCGGSAEPCIPPGNRAYFRPGNNVTRAQLSQIVFLSQPALRR